MFKYVSYTPMTDAFTTHIFNEMNDKCRVHRFDVPYVSVECDNESDFTELMEYQNKVINAAEITKEQFADLVQHSDQVKRMYDVANEQYAKEMNIHNILYSAEERDTWAMQAMEASHIIGGGSGDSPYLSALAKHNGITVAQAAKKIIGKKTEYDKAASKALSKKWTLLKSLKAEVGM